MNEPIGPATYRLSDRQAEAFDSDRAYRNLMGDLGHQQDIEYASYELPPTPAVSAPRATAHTSGVQTRVAVDLESVVLNRIRTSATPVTADTVYRSLPPQMNAKRHRVMQLIDQLVESGAVLRKLASGTHVHTAL
ncbi:hypothetical protein [Rhodococcus pyridinivorans]|uniref:hypothetical protein n=1 Tax=Rhodococcus pyridinivorans TaxID=103816 RepID=UPI0015867259|nr:hypothetical protein [Rhodococcus pyridinivorans]